MDENSYYNILHEILGNLVDTNNALELYLPIIASVLFLACGCLVVSAFLKG